ncbi:tetratricopeptide repeat protein [Rubripirellula reticaptiva]|uniref:Uncharacterized protein n=1 Tax=Rubripirellula reticaptiva TaxID=2528013 RepID=A0A5C6EJI6_9BACT|nr:hypothetical protein [Rubripirellula reticaptiva]TWU49853.1 hypothetical protein Poly59_44780 [Rubripirellula reticaptiva]
MNTLVSRLLIVAATGWAATIWFADISTQDLWAQETPATSASQTRIIDEQIDRLADRSFLAREAAEQTLWQMGPSIEPMLIERSKTASLEAKIRIASIRQKFELGLTADMPKEIQNLTRSLVSEMNSAKRTAGLITLAKEGFMKPVMHLLKPAEPHERYSVVMSILNAAAKQPPSEQIDEQILKLIEIAVTTSSRESIDMTSRIFSSPHVRNRSDDAWLEKVIAILSRCPPDNRFALYSVVRFNQQAMERITSKALLPLWISLIAGEPSHSRQKQLLAQTLSLNRFASNTTYGLSVNRPATLDIVETINSLDSAGQFTLLDYILDAPPIFETLHNKLGDEGILKICASTDDPVHANYVIGRSASHPIWARQKNENEILSLIEKNKDTDLQQQLINGFIDGLSQRSRSTRELPQQAIGAIWQQITQGPPQPWHLPTLLKTYNAPLAFGKKHSRESMQRIIDLAKDTDANFLRELTYAPIRNQTFAAQLAEQERLIEFLHTIRDHASSTQVNSTLTSLMRSASFTDQFDTPESRRSLINFCLALDTDPVRYSLTSGMVGNHELLPKLIADGHFETIMDLLIVGRDGISREDSSYAKLLGEYLSSKAVVDHLIAGNRVDLILNLKSKGISSRLFDQIMEQILRSDDAISAIFNSGRWDALNDLIDSFESEDLRTSSRQTLMTRKAFAENLSRNKEVAVALKRLAEDKAWMDRNLYLSLIENLPADVVENEPSAAIEFWDFAQKLEGYDRDRCVSGLITSRWFAESLVKQNKWKAVAKSIRELLKESRIVSALRTKSTSQQLADDIAAGGLPSLLLLSDLLLDDEARLQFHRQLGESHVVGQWLQADGQPEPFLHALGGVTNENHRRDFAFACFSSRSWNDLADPTSTAEKIVDFVASQPPTTATRMTLGLLSNEKLGPAVAAQDLTNCLRSDIADATSILMKDVAWRRERRNWVSLVKNLPPSVALKQPELGWNLFDIISTDKKNPTSDTLEELLKTPWFISQLSQQQKLSTFLARLKSDFRTWDLRGFATQYAQGPAIVKELEYGSIEVFLGLCDTMPTDEADRVTRYIGSYANIEAWFATSKQPEKIIRVFDSIKDQDRRERFAIAFLSTGILGKQPGNPTIVPQMILYSRKHSDDFQIKIAATLLSQYATDDAAMKTDLPTFLIDQLEKHTDDLEIISLAIRSSNLSKLVLRKNLQRTVIDRILAANDVPSRSSCISVLLGSRTWQTLLTDDDLKTIFSLAQQQGPESLSTLIRKRPYFAERMIEMGQFDVVQRFATMRFDNVDIASQQWAFYVNDAVVRYQRSNPRSSQRSPATLVKLLEARDPAVVQQRLIDISKNGEAARWILDSYGWKPMAEALQRIPDFQRRSVVSQMFNQGKLLAELAQAEQFGKLVQQGELHDFIVDQEGYVYLLRSAEVRKHLDPKQWMDLIQEGYEQSHPNLKRVARMMLKNPTLWEVAIESGQGKWLLETLNQPDTNRLPEEDRKRRRESLTSSRGLLWLAIRTGQFEVAEALLAEFVDDDEGRLRLIRFQMHRQLIEQAAGKPAELSDRFEDLLASDRRLAVYWARCQQDITKAIKLAKEVGDAGLVWSLVLESRDWDALRDLPVCKTKELPVPPITVDISPVHRRIEQLAVLTFLGQASGQSDQSTEPLESWIAQHATTPNTPRYGADALLSVGKIGAARQLLNDQSPRRLFYWHRFQLDYASALECLNWDATTPSKFFEQLSGKAIGTEPLRVNAALFLIQVAMTMRDAGKDGEVTAIMNVLRDHADHPKLDQQAKTKYLRDVAVMMHDRGFPAESRQTISRCDDTDALRHYFYNAYADPSLPAAAADASVWLSEFASRHPEESQRQLLDRVDGAMLAKTPIEQLRPFPDFDGSTVSSGTATTLFRYGRFDPVISMIENATDPRPDDFTLLGQTYLAQENYQSAAAAFFKAFQSNPTDLTRLYLAGDCWGKVGENQRATELKLLARSLAVSQQQNMGLAVGIARVGLKTDAGDIYQTLILNSPPSRPTRIHSVRELALNESDPAKRLAYWDEFVLYHLRPIRFYADLNVWLQSETARRETQCILAIQQQRFDDAYGHWQQLLNINPADVPAAKRIANAFREHGRGDRAAEVISAHQTHLEDRLKQFGNSPIIQQSLESLAD